MWRRVAPCVFDCVAVAYCVAAAIYLMLSGAFAVGINDPLGQAIFMVCGGAVAIAPAWGWTVAASRWARRASWTEASRRAAKLTALSYGTAGAIAWTTYVLNNWLPIAVGPPLAALFGAYRYARQRRTPSATRDRGIQ